jgi:hypothetical protein
VGLFKRIKLLARLASTQGEEPSRELGDLVEPGSTVDYAGMAALGSAGAATGLEQMKELHAAGLIDDDTFKLIETSWANAAAAGYGPSLDAGELELLQHGESAPATVLAVREPSEEPNARPRLTLEVHPTGGSPYEVDCKLLAAHPAAAGLKAGDFLQVKVDPADPQRVAVEWAGLGAA